MKFKTFTTGPGTNSYLVYDEETKEAVVVDAPPESAGPILAAVKDEGLSVKQVVLTHGHWDHLVDLDEVSDAVGAPIVAHEEQMPQLERPGEGRTQLKINPIQPDQWVRHGDTIAVGRSTLQVIEFPGHAPGQFGLYSPDAKALFAGDALFKGKTAIYDLPGSDASLAGLATQRLLELPDDVTVYSGHGEPTTIGDERAMLEEFAAQQQ